MIQFHSSLRFDSVWIGQCSSWTNTISYNWGLDSKLIVLVFSHYGCLNVCKCWSFMQIFHRSNVVIFQTASYKATIPSYRKTISVWMCRSLNHLWSSFCCSDCSSSFGREGVGLSVCVLDWIFYIPVVKAIGSVLRCKYCRNKCGMGLYFSCSWF